MSINYYPEPVVIPVYGREPITSYPSDEKDWFQHPNPILYKEGRKVGENTALYLDILKYAEEHSDSHIGPKQQQILRSVIFHIWLSAVARRPIEIFINKQDALQSVLDVLVKGEYIEKHNGCKVGEFKYSSKIRAPQKLLKMYTSQHIEFDDIGAVRVKKVSTKITPPKKKRGRPQKKKAATKKVRAKKSSVKKTVDLASHTPDGKIITRYNKYMADQNITCPLVLGDFISKDKYDSKTGKWREVSHELYGLEGEFLFDSRVRRGFSGTIKAGGRLSNRGLFRVQGLPKAVRKRITINDIETAEIDYKALHPTMAYHLEGLVPPDEPYEVFANDPAGVLKECVKKSFLTMLNSATRGKAKGSIVFQFFVKKKGRKFGDALSAYFDDEDRYSCADKLLDSISNYHAPIKNWFCSSAWKFLQFKESEIMLDILKNLTGNDVPALPIHDSVIVPKSRAKDVQHLMQTIYMKHMDNFIVAEIQDD